MRLLPPAVLVSAMLAACPAAAQPDADSVRLRNHCRLAVQVIETGHPAPKRDWAHATIASCGAEGGRALAGQLRRLRASTDTAILRQATAPARDLWDGSFYEAAREVFADRAASFPARVYAARVLIWAMGPGGALDWVHLAGSPGRPAPVCLGQGTPIDVDVRLGSPMPADYAEAAKTAAARIAADTTEDSGTRALAHCVVVAPVIQGIGERGPAVIVRPDPPGAQ